MLVRRVLLGAFGLLVGALVWFLWPRPEADDEPRSTGPAAVALPPPPVAGGLRLPSAASAPAASDLAAQLNAPAGDIRRDLRIVQDVIEAFRTNFPRDGNPVGDNAEITATLAGRNRLQLVLLPPNHPAINRAGELCDRWGTPFFFHALSGTRMEIRSAGPDRRLWTEDDVVLTP